MASWQRPGRPTNCCAWQPERSGELEVALVVGGNGHDRAGAIPAEDVVGDIDRDPLPIDRVDRIAAAAAASPLLRASVQRVTTAAGSVAAAPEAAGLAGADAAACCCT